MLLQFTSVLWVETVEGTAEQLVAVLATWHRHILRRIHHDIGVFAVRAISEGFQNQPRLAAGTPTMASYRSSVVHVGPVLFEQKEVGRLAIVCFS